MTENELRYQYYVNDGLYEIDDVQEEVRLKPEEVVRMLVERDTLTNELQTTTDTLTTALRLLRDLADLQNGAPLESYRQQWEATMYEVYPFLDSNNS